MTSVPAIAQIAAFHLRSEACERGGDLAGLGLGQDAAGGAEKGQNPIARARLGGEREIDEAGAAIFKHLAANAVNGGQQNRNPETHQSTS